MSNQIQGLNSLHVISTGYTVFEENQILSAGELNSVSSYLDDQDRLTRLELLGVGLFDGLHVKLAGKKVIVSKGVGITTDGDLLALASDTTFDRYKDYDEKAPFYKPFYPDSTTENTGSMMEVFELVREKRKDEQETETDALAKMLPELPAKLDDMVVVLYQESYLQNHNLCSGTDCDNRGLELTNTQRFLLVSKKDADALLQKLPTADSTLSLALPTIDAERKPVTAKDAATVLTLALPFYEACKNTISAIHTALPALYAKLPVLTGALFVDDPSKDWLAIIDLRFSKTFTYNEEKKLLDSAAPNYTCFYDFLKDIAETWNALCDLLFEDDSVLCPAPDAFPKHLLLGSLANPISRRTGRYPSPLIGNDGNAREHARFLIWKLHVLINTFEPPSDTKIVVTPSNDESVALEERAIPYYYKFDSKFPIHLGWNYRRQSRGAANRNLGYRAASYSKGTERDPLKYQLGRYNFFRIEGHIGWKVDKAKSGIEDFIVKNNLPFSVRAVLLHNDRTKIVIRPPFRHTPLHDLHYILRKDVATQLNDVREFAQSFHANIGTAISNKKIPDMLPINAAGEKKNTDVIAKDHFEKVQASISKLIGNTASKPAVPLDTPSYHQYRNAFIPAAGSLVGNHTEVIKAASTFKINFGDMVRNDLATPLDSLVSNNHSHWLDWLDNLLDHHNTKEDDKLLFSNFLARHPELEHAGGVVRGGTFVLVYDDNANVVADFMLPYFAAETDEAEAEKPELTLPAKTDIAIRGGFTMLQPLETKLDIFKQEGIKQQREHLDLFTNTLQSFNTTTLKNIKSGGAAEVGITGNFADELLKIQVSDIEVKTKQADILRQQINDVTLDQTAKDKASAMLTKVETALSTSIVDSANYIVSNKIDVSSSSDAGKALNFIAQSTSNLANNEVRTQLGKQLTDIQKAAQQQSTTHADTMGRVLKVGGFIK